MAKPKRAPAKGKSKKVTRAKAAKKKVVAPKTRKVAKRQARPATVKRKEMPLAARRAVGAHASSCEERCRVCGAGCSRGGLHEQHRCPDHAGMSM